MFYVDSVLQTTAYIFKIFLFLNIHLELLYVKVSRATFFSFPYALWPPKLTELHCIDKKWRKKCCAGLSWRGYVHQREHSNLFVRRHGWEKRFPPAVRITLWTGFGFVALLRVGNTGKIFLRLGVGRSLCRDAVAERQLWGFIDNSSWSGQETV